MKKAAALLILVVVILLTVAVIAEAIQYRYADGKRDRYPELAAELARLVGRTWK